MVTRMKAIMASLKEIANDNSSNQSDLAAGVYHKIISGKFMISLSFLHKVLSTLDGLSKEMQEHTISCITISSELTASKKILENLDEKETSGRGWLWGPAHNMI